MGQAERHLPPEFWSSPAVAAALASCDFATILEEIRRAHGWTQKHLALAVGYSQSWVSNVLRRQQALTVDQIRDISRRIGVPVHLLRFGDLGGDDPTKRRDFGKAMALALVPLPARALVDETTAPTLTAITGAQRRLDATTSARELARAVIAHVEMANRLLARADKTPFAADVAAAASEAAGFAAWLHADMSDIGTARAFYRMAVRRARHAGKDLLAGYMLGSLAAFEIDSGDPELGLTLIAEARQQIGATPHRVPRAWLDATEALSLAAARRDTAAAAHALVRAAKAIDQDQRSEPPPWPWVFPFDHGKLAWYRALVAVRLTRPIEALAAFTESLSAAQPAPKQRAVVMLEVATAARQDGTGRRDSDRIDEAFRLAGEALAVGVTYSSERVIDRARRFRREYSGPVTSCVQDFDDQLRSALLLNGAHVPHRDLRSPRPARPDSAPGRRGHPVSPRPARPGRDRHVLPGRRSRPDLRPRGHRSRGHPRRRRPRGRVPGRASGRMSPWI
jgi:transcriptional regulator with XRE-family HTH domain